MSLDLVTLALAKKYTDDADARTDEQIAQAVADYLEENPIEAPKPDLTGVVKSVNGKTPDENGNVEITIPDSSQNGNDGFSPIATVTQTEDGATITITDKAGTTTATVTNGKDGKDGEDGTPGTTPHIGANGNWWIGETDTGVSAGGGWKKLIDYTTEEQTWTPDIQQIVFTHDDDGNPLSATRVYIRITGVITGAKFGRLTINNTNFWDWAVSNADEKFCISMFVEFSDGVCCLYSSALDSGKNMTWRCQTVNNTSIRSISVHGGNYNVYHLQPGAHIEIWGM